MVYFTMALQKLRSFVQPSTQWTANPVVIFSMNVGSMCVQWVCLVESNTDWYKVSETMVQEKNWLPFTTIRYFTLVGFISCVNPHVSTQVWWMRKLLSTNRAQRYVQSKMSRQMSFQFIFPVEIFWANCTVETDFFIRIWRIWRDQCIQCCQLNFIRNRF